MKTRLANILVAAIVPAILIALWEFQSRQSGGHAYAFAPLSTIADGFVAMLDDGSLLLHAGVSLKRALTALAIGGTLGILVGTALSTWRVLELTVGPLVNTLRQVPILGWLPLVALWFGNGDGSRLLLVSLAAFYPTALNTQRGLLLADRKLAELGTLYGFSRWQKLRLIAWPSALPLIFTGISQALAFSWIATVGVELLFSANAGLGTLMMAGQVSARTDIVIICIVCVGVMGFALNQGFGLIRSQALKWQPASYSGGK